MYKVSALVARACSFGRRANNRLTVLCIAVCAMALAAFPAFALATETAAEIKVKEIATNVGTESVNMLLIIVAGCAVAIGTYIAVTLGIRKIRTLIK